MNWKPELDELMRREGSQREIGGADKVKRQHAGGRQTWRPHRGLVDPQAFTRSARFPARRSTIPRAIWALMPSNCVFGRGLIDGRPVVVVGDDFTVRGGSADATIGDKPLMAEQMASDLRLPIVRIIDGSGGGGSVKTIETTGAANLPGRVGGRAVSYYTTANLAQVPVVGAGPGLGRGARLGSACGQPLFDHDRETSAMFVAGPPVVARAAEILARRNSAAPIYIRVRRGRRRRR